MLFTNHKEFVDRLLGCWSGWTTSCYTQRRIRNFWSPFRTFFEICLEFGLKVIALNLWSWRPSCLLSKRLSAAASSAKKAWRAILVTSRLCKQCCFRRWLATWHNFFAHSIGCGLLSQIMLLFLLYFMGFWKMLQSGWWLDLKSWPNFLFLNYGSPHTQIHFTHYSEQ